VVAAGFQLEPWKSEGYLPIAEAIACIRTDILVYPRIYQYWYILGYTSISNFPRTFSLNHTLNPALDPALVAVPGYPCMYRDIP
jgi:hypothetical protein